MLQLQATFESWSRRPLAPALLTSRWPGDVRPWFLVMLAALLAPAMARPALGQVGACCLPDNSCQQLTEASCAAINDSFYVGEGSGCAFFNCASVGACCLPDGTCERRTQSSCAESAGTFRGENTRCAGTECAQPVQTGACCLPNGTCQTLSPQACSAASGTYSGNNSLCANVNCTPTPPPIRGLCGNIGGASAALFCMGTFWAIQRRRRR